MVMSLEDSLFIKQAAILEVIREHKIISSRELRRKFLGIKDRTLRYHIKKLTDAGLIKKRGTTKGVYYEAS
ncbi:MAG: helix-turn-helix domain-containing protein [Candidatus Daviesbacteria bacterium]|nr:helix-turn-helix domain-containing protein [Candidatus Daviesbacteria bacterium]